MITVEDLRRVKILQGFEPETLETLLPSLMEREYGSGETIIRRGDPGSSMFIIFDGTVSVTLRNDEGIDYEINTQGPGENFGEMALMTGEPRSATVTASSPVRLAELSQEAFFELVSRFPRVMDDLLRQLTQRRGRTLVRQEFEALRRDEVIANLFAQQPPEIDHLVGRTKWAADTNAAIRQLAADSANVLIISERGTGKDLAARLIHFLGTERSKPLFHLDCANPPPIHRESEEGKAPVGDDLHREIAQESALFGHGRHAGSFARGVRRGYLELADGGSLLLENVEFLSLHAQRLLASYAAEGSFVRVGEEVSMTSRVRLIATSSRSLQDLKQPCTLDQELFSLLNARSLVMKPLRERKKDIPDLAEYLREGYNRKFAKTVAGFSTEAMNNLVDHDWPLNLDEMRQVIERAVVIADNDIISERQVFLNVPSFTTAGKFNLLRLPPVKAFVTNRLVPQVLRFLTVPFILGLTILTLLGPPQKNPANLMVWAIWWPFLLFSVAVAARSWCGFCPLPVISDGINYLRKKFFPIPSYISRYGVWVGIVGFAGILLSEHAADMFSAARATSALLLCIIAGATIVNFLFGKRSWCKYVCPLGRMVAQSSTVSILELGTNSNVCLSQCQTHDCVKDGNCPMGIHPSAAGTSKECILCLSCLKKCRHQSVRLSVRFPWQEILVREKWSLAEAFFATSLTALVLAVKLPAWEPFSRAVVHAVPLPAAFAEMVVSLTTGLLFVLMVLFVSGLGLASNWKQQFSVMGNGYLFLAFTAFFNIYFHELVYNGPNFMVWLLKWIGVDRDIPPEWVVPNLGTLKALIPLITLVGAGGSYFAFSWLAKKFQLPLPVRRGHQVLLGVTSLLFLLIL